MSFQTPRVIAIVGSGFSGTAAAVQLLRRTGARPLKILIIERGAEFGRGVAYAQSPHPYLLNVPASRMSATLTDPGEFLRFARQLDPTIDGEDFLPRALYGEYLQKLLEAAAAQAPATVQLEFVRGEVTDLVLVDEIEHVTLTLANGLRVRAHEVILALGTPGPRLSGGIRCAITPPRLRENPWSRGQIRRGRGPLLVIGTGLTMVDVVSAEIGRDPHAEIHAISRHGLVPMGQTEFRPMAIRCDKNLSVACAGRTSRLVSAARRLAQQAERNGGDWREAVTHLRDQVPILWPNLARTERSRFLRHVRPYWDIHRHRIPGHVLTRLNALRASGQLSVHAGRIQSLEETDAGVRATWIPRGTSEPEELHAAEVVDCTGPDCDITRSPDPLWRALLARGLAAPDSLRLGVRTADWGALIAKDGTISDRLFYIGPLLRADHWEATAVGELRVHAQRLGEYLATRCL
jgi:uncharacterized NAD(P)/FAD-binding protein YdhS